MNSGLFDQLLLPDNGLISCGIFDQVWKVSDLALSYEPHRIGVRHPSPV